jgi:poly(A) polymerase
MRIKAGWLKSNGPVTVFKLLQDAGFQAFFVGGCVRNALLNIGTTDIDMATDARPETVMDLAKAHGLRVIPTGIEHGTVTFVIDGRSVELTTFRKDIKTDGRRAVVAFSTSMIDDAKRRDFTMNALYADLDGQVSDPLGGLQDLQARRVRFIENPAARIREDYLRILRFFRFHALYGDLSAGLDADALSACADNLDGISTLSKERIGHEMRKLLAADNPAPSVAAMAQTGILAQVIAGATHQSLAPLIHLESTLDIPPNWLRRLLALRGENIQTALRLSKQEARLLADMKSIVENARPPRIAAYRLGYAAGLDTQLVLHAHLGTALPENLQEQLEIGASAVFPVSASDLPDLQGPALGARLKRLETAWTDAGFDISKQDLLTLSRNHD